MDTLRDNMKGDLENKGHKETLKRTSDGGIFMSVSKKAEKITTALYMLTDLIREDDPIRHQIRRTSLVILSETRGLSHALTGDLYFAITKIIGRAWELVSFMEVCVVVGFVSDMNYNIMKDALVEFISDLRNKQRMEGFANMRDMKAVQGQATGLYLSSDFFSVDKADISAMSEERDFYTGNSYKRHIKDTSLVKRTYKGLLPRSNEKTDPSENQTTLETQDKVSQMRDRKEKILELVKDKKDISIKDILYHFSGQSPKTIQRDLNTLIEEGRLVRQGEKRWSRYSIKSP